MTLNALGYTPTGLIRIVVDGETRDIPDEMSNADRRAVAVWERDGNTIPTYTPPAIGYDVNAECERRLSAGKVINGMLVTGKPADRMNLTNLALVAQVRVTGGDTTTLTTYRDGNNVNHDLTPVEILDIWSQAVEYVQAIYKTSWDMKGATGAFPGGIPADYTNDTHWPSLV